MLTFSDAETTTLEKRFWFLKRTLAESGGRVWETGALPAQGAPF